MPPPPCSCRCAWVGLYELGATWVCQRSCGLVNSMAGICVLNGCQLCAFQQNPTRSLLPLLPVSGGGPLPAAGVHPRRSGLRPHPRGPPPHAARLPAAAQHASRLQPLCCLAPGKRWEGSVGGPASTGGGHADGGVAAQRVGILCHPAAATGGRSTAGAAAAYATGATATACFVAVLGSGPTQPAKPQRQQRQPQQCWQWRHRHLWLLLPRLRPAGEALLCCCVGGKREGVEKAARSWVCKKTLAVGCCLFG